MLSVLTKQSFADKCVPKLELGNEKKHLPMKPKLLLLTAVLALAPGLPGWAQDTPAAPEVLPGKGLAEHDFFYAGEAKDRKMFIVRKGQIVWSYDDPEGKGEISDAVLLSNGNVALAHQRELLGIDRLVYHWSYQ